MAKNEKQVPTAPAMAEKPKSKKKLLLIVIGVVALSVAGAAGWYFTAGRHKTEPAKTQPAVALQPIFVALEPFTVNLQGGESAQYLQVGLSFKIFNPELQDKIKLSMPEIRSKLLLLLSSKHASELSTLTGKKNLVGEIIADTDDILGIPHPPVRISPPPASPAAAADKLAAADMAAHLSSASGVVATISGVAASAPVAPAPSETDDGASADDTANTQGIADVLFTSFIIQ
jgi:flagellar protein FliL